MSAWNPIETAPKNETSILACNGTIAGGFPQVVYWYENRWHVDDAAISYHPDFFTHWMWLPPPPPIVRR